MREQSPIGIFGGTFDPVHLGHLRLAEEAADKLGLAGVRWVPAGQPRHRETPQVAPMHRLQMVQIATAGNPRFSIDRAEVERDEISYTVPTLERLRQKFGPTQPLVLLLGADAYAGLPDWHRWQEIFSLAHIAVAHRPGFVIDVETLPEALADEHRQRLAEAPALAAETAGKITTYAMTPLAISATAIRAQLAAGDSLRYLLPQPVIDYIHLHNLYRSSDGS
ncbi:MAG: nicotinate-nucleotide adenylyltransferase [Betaproteobacteria bacterium]|uniref:Probable nicotinate-nucleotide adenylyltransferase n=1 Tax=Candidatus Proximibacter danicus TaxID=2954365 RepID=A0A9D7K746_9PROT|nr:nicotinate-nucleotide adenylyltransferase [Candidatus Proximibacter danicus]